MANYFELDEQTEEKLWDIQSHTAHTIAVAITDKYPQLEGDFGDISGYCNDAISNQSYCEIEYGVDATSASEDIQDDLKRYYNIEISDEFAEEIASIIEEDNIEYAIFEEEED